MAQVSLLLLVLLVFLLLINSSILVAQSPPPRTTIPPVTVVGSEASSCPSIEQRGEARAKIDELVHAALCSSNLPGILRENPAASCSDIFSSSLGTCPSGSYWLRSSTNVSAAMETYCDMGSRCCNSVRGGWTRLGYLNMLQPEQTCPDGWRGIVTPRRLCGRDGSGGGCESVSFPSNGLSYSRICGRVVAYQYASPDGFEPYRTSTPGIDGVYVDGVSITHGNQPRQHVWTMVTGLGGRAPHNTCPCADTPGADDVIVPPYVGEDYFCELSNTTNWGGTLFHGEPLWDGAGCREGSSCCEFNQPPWFCKQLPESTSDDLEVRLCGEQSYNDEDTPIELIELYVL